MKKRLALITLALCMSASATAFAETSVTEESSTDAVSWVNGTDVLLEENEDDGDDDVDSYFLVDTDGKKLTDGIYDSSMSYSCGMMTGKLAVSDDDDNINICGIMDSQGNVLVPFEYAQTAVYGSHWAAGFNYKKADYSNYDEQIDDDYYLIDTVDIYHVSDGTAEKAGSLTRDEFSQAVAFNDYLCVENRSTGKCTLYDGSFRKAEEDLDSVYDTGETNTDDYEIYYEDGKYGLKDADGKVVLEPTYDYISSFYGNYAAVTEDDRTGLIDRDGNEILKPEYDSVEVNYTGPSTGEDTLGSYEADGYFTVVKDGLLGFVDFDGNVTAEPSIASDVCTVNGASVLYTDLSNKTHILAADGTDTVLPDDYEDVYALTYCSGEYYLVMNDDYDTGLIDWHGQEILPCEYYGISSSGSGRYLLVQEDYDEADIYSILPTLQEGGTAAEETEAVTEADADTETAAEEITEAAKQ